MKVLLKVSAPSDIPLLIAEKIYKEENLDYSGILLIFPGKRPAYYVLKHLSEKIKKPYLPPVSFSFAEFVEETFKSLFPGYRKISSLDAVYYLFNAFQSLPQKNKIPSIHSLSDFLPWGFLALETMEELEKHLLYEEKSLKVLEREIPYWSGEIPERAIQFLSLFSSLREKFLKFLEERGFVTEGIIYRKLAITEKIFEKRFSEGFILLPYSLTPSEEKIMNKIQDMCEKTTYIYQKPGSLGLLEELEEPPFLKNFECVEEGEEKDFHPKVSIYRAPDLHGEMELLREKICELPESELKFTAIVLPDPENLPAFLWNVLSCIDVDYNITMGYPLTRTPVFSLISLILKLGEEEHKGKISLLLFMRVLRHPFIKTIKLNNGDYFRNFIFSLEGEMRKTEKTFASEEELMELGRMCSGDGESYDVYLKVTKSIFSILNSRNIQSFCSSLMSFLHFIRSRGDAILNPLNDLFFNSLLEVLKELKSSEIASRDIEREEIYYLFKHFSKRKRVPFSGFPLASLQVLGLLETRGLYFKNVFLLDLNEGILPSLEENSLLPPPVRRFLNLPLPQEREKVYRYYFTNLFNSTEAIHLFYIDSDEMRKSRFLEEIELADFLDEKKIFDRSSFSYHFYLKSGERRNFEKTEEIIEYIKGEGLDPTAIDLYIDCPAKFYFSRILKLEEKAPSDDEDYLQVGKIVHIVLEEIFKDVAGREKIEKSWIEKWLKPGRIERVFEKFYPSGESEEKELILFTSALYLRAYLEKFREEIDGLKILFIEKELSCPFKLDDELMIPLKGRIDRIDFRDGEYIVIDYKTGASAETPSTSKKGLPPEERKMIKKIIKSFQLPIYIYLFRTNLKKDYEEINGCLLILRKIFKSRKEYFRLLYEFEKESRKDLMENYFLPSLRSVIREILDPSKPFSSDPVDARSCERCSFGNLCKR